MVIKRAPTCQKCTCCYPEWGVLPSGVVTQTITEYKVRWVAPTVIVHRYANVTDAIRVFNRWVGENRNASAFIERRTATQTTPVGTDGVHQVGDTLTWYRVSYLGKRARVQTFSERNAASSWREAKMQEGLLVHPIQQHTITIEDLVD